MIALCNVFNTKCFYKPSQFIPLKPSRQEQSKLLPEIEQVPLNRHGEIVHGVTEIHIKTIEKSD
jgi:hypothetical protein